jgi:ATP-binding cassette subfamily F protein uup
MPPPLLTLDGIKLTFGGTPLLDGASLSVSQGDKIALVGRNGSGKSTLLKIAAGMIEPQDGEIFRQPTATVRYLPQAPDTDGFATVRAYVEAGFGPADDPHRATYLLDHLGLTGDEDPATLSGGEARRAALASVMAPEPDILLLDEPTNHLDLATIEWLEEELIRRSSALVMISHDRRFLERISTAPPSGSIAAARAAARQGLSRISRNGATRSWRKRSATSTSSAPDRARGALAALRRDRAAQAQHAPARRIAGHAPAPSRPSRRRGNGNDRRQRGAESGKLVIEAKGSPSAYGELTVVSNFSTRIQRGDRIGLVGPNGAGKTTLLKMLTGAAPTRFRHGTLGVNLEIAALDQTRSVSNPTRRWPIS